MIYLIVALVIAFIIIIRQDIIHKQEIRSIEIKHVSLINEQVRIAIKKSKDVTRGQISQEFIPLFPDFPYNMSDCKFSGQPIDFIVFKGMSDMRDGIETDIEIIFADVKTNKSKKTKIQNAIKKAIDNNKVKWETWNVLDNKQIKFLQ